MRSFNTGISNTGNTTIETLCYSDRAKGEEQTKGERKEERKKERQTGARQKKVFKTRLFAKENTGDRRKH